MTTIDEKTKLPLSFLAVVMPAIIGLVVWLTSVEAKITTHDEIDDARVREIQAKQEKITELFYSIDRRLARIEGKLGVKSGLHND